MNRNMKMKKRNMKNKIMKKQIEQIKEKILINQNNIKLNNNVSIIQKQLLYNFKNIH
jgi:hypothetical protein